MWEKTNGGWSFHTLDPPMPVLDFPVLDAGNLLVESPGKLPDPAAVDQHLLATEGEGPHGGADRRRSGTERFRQGAVRRSPDHLVDRHRPLGHRDSPFQGDREYGVPGHSGE